MTRNASTLNDLAFSSLDDLWDQWPFVYSSRSQVRHDLESAPQDEPWFETRKSGETDPDWALRLRRCKLWHLMVSPNPEDRGFFQACKSARVQRREQAALGVWLEPGGPLETILDFVDEWRAEPRRRVLEPFFRAHLLCAREAVAPDFWPATGTVSEPALKRIQAETKLPLNHLRDLAAELCDRPCSPGAEPVASVVVLLVEGKERGQTASLDFELVSPGEGLIYPAPAMALISRDQDFRNGEETARDYVGKALDLPDPKRDIRWSLRMRESQLLPTEIYGPSASAAQALLLAYLRA